MSYRGMNNYQYHVEVYFREYDSTSIVGIRGHTMRTWDHDFGSY